MFRHDRLQKILVLGDNRVGKTCLIDQATGEEFTREYLFTIAINFKTTLVEVHGKKVKLQIW